MSTTPEPKVKQKRIREPDCHKKGGWVAIGTFVVTHPSEKVPILCNTRYKRTGCLAATQVPEKGMNVYALAFFTGWAARFGMENDCC